MWWQLALAILVGVAVGGDATTMWFYLFHSAIRDIRDGYIPERWSSAGKEWPAFAEWVRHGGRKLISDAAFSAARNGMSEADVRAIFGPPDLVVVGAEEFTDYSVACEAQAVHIFTKLAGLPKFQTNSPAKPSRFETVSVTPKAATRKHAAIRIDFAAIIYAPARRECSDQRIKTICRQSRENHRRFKPFCAVIGARIVARDAPPYPW